MEFGWKRALQQRKVSEESRRASKDSETRRGRKTTRVFHYLLLNHMTLEFWVQIMEPLSLASVKCQLQFPDSFDSRPVPEVHPPYAIWLILA